MIPKTIHYCWFGRNPLPASALRCIESWRKFLPGYEIKEWNEDNYDVRAVPYTSEAYDAGKYAFVSDYARFRILYENGGVYFDTDVELIRPIDDILARGAFMGFETDCGDEPGMVNPGLGIAAEKGDEIYGAMLDHYKDMHFRKEDGSFDTTTVVFHTSEVLRRHGMRDIPGIQQAGGITLYPAEYFNPFDWKTGLPHPTSNSRSIHWYTKTWMSPGRRVYQKFKYYSNRILGKKTIAAVKKMLGLSGKVT